MASLCSSDGSRIDLDILGYEFPDGSDDPDYDTWDANWLVVRIKLISRAEECGDFVDPCLTTWELRQLISWLEAVGERGDRGWSTSQTPIDTRLEFTEQGLVLGLEECAESQLGIMFEFTADIPGANAESFLRTQKKTARVAVNRHSLRVFIEELESLSSCFPERTIVDRT